MRIQWKARLASVAGLVIAAFLGSSPQLAAAQVSTEAQLAAQGKVRVVVSYKSGAGAAALAAIAAAGGRVVVDLSDVDAVAAEVPARARAALQRSPAVQSVDDDPMRYAFGTFGKRSAARIKPMSGGTQVSPYGIGMVQADQLSDVLAFDRKLCIVDSGIDRVHEDLNGITVDGVNLTTSGEWFTDEASHGTHVAGTIAAIDNTIGVLGVLPHEHISIYIAKVFDASGSAPSSVIAKGMLACMRARANVVSMSLGGSQAGRLEQRVVDRLASRNILIIAAAGNSGTSDISYPAGFANVVSVAAIDSTMTVASFSQFNDDVELSGPGVHVLSTVPVGIGTGPRSRSELPRTTSSRWTARR